MTKNAAENDLQASKLKELSDFFQFAGFEALGADYPLVTEPGNDVLRVRLAITNIETSNPAVLQVPLVVGPDINL